VVLNFSPPEPTPGGPSEPLELGETVSDPCGNLIELAQLIGKILARRASQR